MDQSENGHDDFEFSSQQLEELREAFALFDKDGDGFITTEELLTVMHSLRQKATEEEIRDMIHQVDIDGRQGLSFEDFCEVVAMDYRKQSAQQEMRKAFAVFDQDGDGFIDGLDIKRTMLTLGENISETDVASMVAEADMDGDGRINFKEFFVMMKQRFTMSMESLEADAKFSEEQRRELKLAFSLFDRDKDGNISMAEVRHVMDTLGQRINDKQLQAMFKQVDLDGNGLIDFEEFVRLMENRMERHQSEDAELRSFFSAFDKDNNGYIDANELKATMNQVGMRLSDADVRAMMKEAGVEYNGRIFYEDFVCMMTGKIGKAHKRITQCNSDNPEQPPVPIDEEEEEDQETQELRVAFAMFDQDGDGSITSKELVGVMTSLGVDTSTNQVKAMIRKVDLDGNGTIEFEEFKKLMKKRRNLAIICKKDRREDEVEMRQAFSVFDKDANGYIDANELCITMKELGVQLSKDDVTAMMHEAGVKADGRIYYEEFVRIMFGKIIKPQNQHMDEFTTDQIQDMKVAFALFDKDGDGAITASELRTVMHSLGFDLDDKMVAKMIDRFDYDGNGTLEFDEFVKMMTAKNKSGLTRWDRCKPDAESEPDAWRAFKVFDRDRNGYITSVELKRTMTELGVQLSDEDAQLMIAEADLDGDGKINYHEFVNMMEGKFQGILTQVGLSQTDAQEEPHVTAKIAVTTTTAATVHAQNSTGKSPRHNQQQHQQNQQLQHQQHQQQQKGNNPDQKLFRDISLEDMKEAFRLFDRDQDGFIQASELGAVMRQLGLSYSPQDLRNMIQNADPRGNGTVDFNEFLKMMSRSRSRHSTSEETRRRTEEEEMRTAFKVFDIDGNGFIDAQELRLTMQNLGEKLSDDDVKAMIREADMNGDGQIDYEEFIRMMFAKNSSK